MIRLWKILGTGLIVLFIALGFYQRGWAEERYTVKPGDTLYGISKSFGVSIGVEKSECTGRRFDQAETGSHHSIPGRKEGG